MFCPKTLPLNCSGNENLRLCQTEECDRSPIIMRKELLAQNVHSVILWYGELCIINIWYCWMIIEPISSNIPSNSFYVWQSCQYIFLESSCVSCDDVLRFFCCFFCGSFYSCSWLQWIFTLGISCVSVLVYLGNKSVRSIQCYFGIASIFTAPLNTFPIRPSVG